MKNTIQQIAAPALMALALSAQPGVANSQTTFVDGVRDDVATRVANAVITTDSAMITSIVTDPSFRSTAGDGVDWTKFDTAHFNQARVRPGTKPTRNDKRLVWQSIWWNPHALWDKDTASLFTQYINGLKVPWLEVTEAQIVSLLRSMNWSPKSKLKSICAPIPGTKLSSCHTETEDGNFSRTTDTSLGVTYANQLATDVIYGEGLTGVSLSSSYVKIGESNGLAYFIRRITGCSNYEIITRDLAKVPEVVKKEEVKVSTEPKRNEEMQMTAPTKNDELEYEPPSAWVSGWSPDLYPQLTRTDLYSSLPSLPIGSISVPPIAPPIPEPETYALMALGLSAIALRRRWGELKNRANQFLGKLKRK